MNSACVNLHCYYSNFVNLHIFSLINVGDFKTWICKIESLFFILFCILSYANALTKCAFGIGLKDPFFYFLTYFCYYS